MSRIRFVTRALIPFALLGLIGVTQAQSLNMLEVDRLVSDAMKRHSVPGVGLAVVMDGKIVYTKGYGVRDTKTNTAVNADTLFAIGSVSKSFTSLGAMQLVDSGKLSLSTKANAILPNLKFSDSSKGANLTLQNLLSHTSGMNRADDLWYFDKTVKTREDMLGTVAKIPFNEPIGTTWQYCNQNFVIAGAMLEKTTGKTWEEYTRQNIFAPLGMKRSLFETTDAVKDGNYAQGFQLAFKGVDPMPAFDRMVIAGPAGSIISSASDMAQYAALQLSNGTWNNQKIISQKALETMHSRQIEISDFPSSTPGLAFPSYGLAWFNEEYRGVSIVEHGGNIDGFTAEVQLVPSKGLGIVILANLNGANTFTNEVRLGITERALGMTPLSQFKPSALTKQLEAAKTFKPDLTVLKSLEGKYTLITGDSAVISLKDGQLSLNQGGQNFPMVAASKTEFILNVLGTLVALEFQIDPSGLVWILQDGTVVGARMPASSSSSMPTPASVEFTNTANQYSLTIPGDLTFAQQTPNFSVFQSAKPEATVIVATSKAQSDLEQSVKTVVNQFDPSFKQKPDNVRELPLINGVTWTQYIYQLPNDQILVALAARKGNTAFVIITQLKTADLNAFTPTVNQLLLSFKILI
jgi:CubicO group peptidase (beta-lactamase class C family)